MSNVQAFKEAVYSGPRFIAHFEPQAWINDHAVTVDDKGPDTWDCTAYILEKGSRFTQLISDHIATRGVWFDNDDILKHDSQAPQWVQDWHGPFAITVRLASDLEVTPIQFQEAVATQHVYRVRLDTKAWMKATVDVRAANETEARRKAVAAANNGDVVWEYDELDDTADINVIDVEDRTT